MTSTSMAATLMLSVVTIVADSCLKRAGQEEQSLNLWFAAGIVIYTLSAFGWVYVFRHLTFAEAGVIYSVSVMLMLVFAGVFFFKETLKFSECAGISRPMGPSLSSSRFLLFFARLTFSSTT